MSLLRFCTLTGVDESTNLIDLARISSENAMSEWGVLFSRSRMAEDAGSGRYPREQWISEFASFALENEVPAALHLCGNDAIEFLRGNDVIRQLAGQFERVQLNVRAEGLAIEDLDVAAIGDSIRDIFHCGFNTQSVIMQYNHSNAGLCRALSPNTRGFEALVDSSGGRGVLPGAWKLGHHDLLGMPIGFAGGLGPDNIGEQLPLMAEAANGKPFWVDMESKLRSADDKFDLSACERVLHHVGRWSHEQLAQAGAAAQECDKPETKVSQLQGLYLDWWAGLAAGYRMVVPPQNASRPMYLSKTYGDYNGFEPSENAHQLNDLVEEFGVGCIRKVGASEWTGLTSDGQAVKASSRATAMLRAVVLEAFGPTLPSNPADEPFLHSVWLGEVAGARSVAEFNSRLRKSRP